jgi:exodeoxyribonuclease V beta subunit
MSAPQAFHLTETPLARGTSLIEASAGTGKTYAITALFVRLILEENLSVREILVVTYTEAATEELRHRIRQTLADALRAFESGSSDIPFLKDLVDRHSAEAKEMEARLQNALCGFDEAPIYTIHGFCQRMLKDRAFESSLLFDIELVTDPRRCFRKSPTISGERIFTKPDPPWSILPSRTTAGQAVSWGCSGPSSIIRCSNSSRRQKG